MKYPLLNYLERLFVGKLSYFLYSPISWIKLILYGIEFQFPCWFAGIPYVCRHVNSKIKFGKNCHFMSKVTGNPLGISHKCIFHTGAADSKILIGDNCSFSGVSICSFKSIRIGNNVRCGANVVIIDSDFHPEDPRSGWNKAVLIEDNVWIGMNVIILKGVTIGRNSLIGAGSIVTKCVPENVLAAGNPCRVIRQLEPDIISSLNKANMN